MLKKLCIFLLFANGLMADIKGIVFDCDVFTHANYLPDLNLGLKLGVVSGKPQEQMIAELQELGIEHFFDTIVSGNAEVSICNTPEVYLYMWASKNMGLMPQECIAIVDSQKSLDAAATAGYKTMVVVRCRHNFNKPDFVIESLVEINKINFGTLCP